MSLPLDKVRDAAKAIALTARELEAEKATIQLVLDGEEKYHVTIDRDYKTVGKAPNKKRELQGEFVKIRKNSVQGDIIYASPLGWM